MPGVYGPGYVSTASFRRRMQFFLRADTGSYLVTGQPAGSNFAILTADLGSYAVTGQATGGVVSIVAEPGTYTVTGQDAFQVRTMLANAGAYAVAGNNVLFSASMVAAGGVYTVTGQSALAILRLLAEPGQYTIIGIPVADALGPTGDLIFLIEAQGHDGSGLQYFYFSSRSFTTVPGDSPANQFYDNRVFDPGTLTRSLFSSTSLRGRPSASSGDVELISADPGNGETLDPMLGLGFGGQPLTIRTLQLGQKLLSLSFTLFKGRSKRIASDRPLQRVLLQIRERFADLDLPLLSTRFAGTTVASAATAEGNADLKGKIKPRAYGTVRNVPLQPANIYDRIYLASLPGGTAINSIAVFDGAKALTPATVPNYATIAALRAATTGIAGSGADIEAGEYATCLAAGVIRVAGFPEFDFTADVTVGATAADRTAAQVVLDILTDFGMSGVDWVAGTFTILDGLNDAEVGIYIDDERTALEAVCEILDSINGWLRPNRDATLMVGQFGEPEANPALVFNLESDVIGDSLIRGESEEPVWQIVLEYARNYNVSTVFAGAATDDRRTFSGNEFRTVIAEDASVKTQFADARTLTVRTLLVSEADAQAEADRQLDLLKVLRDRYTVSLPLDLAWYAEPGMSIKLVSERMGWGSGKSFVIMSRADEFKKKLVTLEIWG